MLAKNVYVNVRDVRVVCSDAFLQLFLSQKKKEKVHTNGFNNVQRIF